MGGELLLDVGAPATDLTLAKAVHNKQYKQIKQHLYLVKAWPKPKGSSNDVLGL